MIDAGRQRLNPFKPRRAGEHEIAYLDAEHDHHIDAGKFAGHLLRAVEQRELQRGKFLAQLVAVLLGVNVDDKDFAGHVGVNYAAWGRPK
jgi:hypothetical protein